MLFYLIVFLPEVAHHAKIANHLCPNNFSACLKSSGSGASNFSVFLMRG